MNLFSAGGKKKAKKPKGKTLNLNEFLSDDKGNSGPGASYVLANKPVSWADEVENQEAEGNYVNYLLNVLIVDFKIVRFVISSSDFVYFVNNQQ